jgi:hypothetical protein
MACWLEKHPRDPYYHLLSALLDAADAVRQPPCCRGPRRRQLGLWHAVDLDRRSGDKNRGWDLLCEAKQELRPGPGQRPPRCRAGRRRRDAQLAICESSDWFWWFGDYNPSAAVASFDSLYRRNLARLYRCCCTPIWPDRRPPPATCSTRLPILTPESAEKRIAFVTPHAGNQAHPSHPLRGPRLALHASRLRRRSMRCETPPRPLTGN